MRRTTCALLFVTACTIGCATGPFQRREAAGPAYQGAPPRPEQVVAHLNQNAQRIHSVQFTEAKVDVKQGMKSFGVNAMIHYQKPRDFRMTAEAVGSSQADIGSNNREFWFWFKQEGQGLAYCSYEDLPRLRRMPLPIHPDWIAEGLCVQEFPPSERPNLRVVGQTVELTSQTRSPQGEPLQKVTVVALSGPNGGKIIRHHLRNSQGQDIWSAEIREYHRPEMAGGHIVPRKITLRSSAEKMEIDFKLDGCQVNSLVAGRTGRLFERPPIQPEINLARGTATPSSIQRVRGSSD
jgi:hypothetical protein